MKNLLKILLLVLLLGCGNEVEEPEPGPPVIETAEELKEFLEGEWINPISTVGYVARFWEDSLLIMSNTYFDVSFIAYYHVIDKDSIRIRRPFLEDDDYFKNFINSRNKIHIYTMDSIRIERWGICGGCQEEKWIPISFKRTRY